MTYQRIEDRAEPDRPAHYPPSSQSEAIGYLARRMWETIESFDPTGSPSWDQIEEDTRCFYKDVMMVVLEADDAVRVALGESAPLPRN